MPPKKNRANIKIIKVKRQATTYMVDISLKDTVDTLKEKLVQMINTTDGLKLIDKPIGLQEQDSMKLADINNESIKIPNIDLIDDSDSETENNVNNDKNNDQIDSDETKSNSNQNSIQISADGIKLGVFNDPNDIYNSEIADLDVEDTTKVEKLNLQDFATLAFKYGDEPYTIYEPKYE
jgi:hypothetical protein